MPFNGMGHGTHDLNSFTQKLTESVRLVDQPLIHASSFIKSSLLIGMMFVAAVTGGAIGGFFSHHSDHFNEVETNRMSLVDTSATTATASNQLRAVATYAAVTGTARCDAIKTSLYNYNANIYNTFGQQLAELKTKMLKMRDDPWYFYRGTAHLYYTDLPTLAVRVNTISTVCMPNWNFALEVARAKLTFFFDVSAEPLGKQLLLLYNQ